MLVGQQYEGGLVSVMLAVEPPPRSSEVGLDRGRERECPWVVQTGCLCR